MSKLINDRLLRTIWQQPVDVTPIWIMRQAGRYLPEYRAVREKAGSFLALCKNPELACEVTLQPLRRYALDASIVFSDILTIPDAMGLGLGFREGEGPYFERPLRRVEDIKQLPIPDPDTQLHYVLDAIRMIQHELDGSLPLLGFCGSPWTLAAYMVEGRSKSDFAIIKDALARGETWLHLLLDKLSEAVSLHLNAQIAAGVQAVMLFDTWGSILPEPEYREYSLRYIQQTFAKVTREHNGQIIPRILYTRGNRLNSLAEVGCDVISVDAEVNLTEARQALGQRYALQGNLDIDMLRRSQDELEQGVADVLKAYGQGSGHIFNLGHGITPDINPEQVSILVDAVHRLSKSYHL